jgi:Flp pilus assembly protein TadG
LARGLVWWRDRILEERGAILVFVAVSLVGILGFSGLAIDLGRGYVTKIRLSRAVDAAAIEAASSIRLGQAKAEEAGRAVAAINGIVDGVDGISLSLSFDVNLFGETTVTARASQSMTTTFSRILGQDELDLSTEAVAAVPPVDMVFVLDQSGSLGKQGVWDDLQSAANEFVTKFDDSLDQLGLVHFQIRAADAFEIDDLFTTSITNAIDNMNSAGDTNTGEGLRFARKQIKSKVVRERSAKIVVFFTDGRPTAFRDEINGRDRVIAVDRVSRGNVRGLFENPETLPMSELATPDDCVNAPTCYGWTEATVREEARQRGLHWADKIRSEGVVIYTIGLGNPSATDPIETPDIGYLELLANVGGTVDADQPHGRAYFAPSAAQLQDVFHQVARDLMVRLAK